MRGIIKNCIKNEKGAATVMEATIVFPIMIIVIVFLIYLGNAMFQMSKISSAVSRYAVDGATMCIDTYYDEIAGKTSVPSSFKAGIEPYRYLLKSDKSHTTAVEKEIKKRLNNTISSHGFFLGMEPKITYCDAKYINKFFYSSFVCEVRYSIVMGVKLWGEKNFEVIKSSDYADVAVNDPADFIRNTNMVIDYIEGTEKGTDFINKISDAMGKVKDFLGLVGG